MGHGAARASGRGLTGALAGRSKGRVHGPGWDAPAGWTCVRNGGIQRLDDEAREVMHGQRGLLLRPWDRKHEGQIFAGEVAEHQVEVAQDRQQP